MSKFCYIFNIYISLHNNYYCHLVAIPQNAVGVHDLQCKYCSLTFGSNTKGIIIYHHRVSESNVNNVQKRSEANMKKDGLHINIIYMI